MVAAVAALGLRRAKPSATQNSRIVAGIIRVPILGGLLIASSYGWSGEGPRGRNLELLATIPQLARAKGLPILVGGDFNLSPAQIRTTGILRKGELDCIHPEVGTCVTGSWRGASTIDLFIAAEGLRAALGRRHSDAQKRSQGRSLLPTDQYDSVWPPTLDQSTFTDWPCHQGCRR